MFIDATKLQSFREQITRILNRTQLFFARQSLAGPDLDIDFVALISCIPLLSQRYYDKARNIC